MNRRRRWKRRHPATAHPYVPDEREPRNVTALRPAMLAMLPDGALGEPFDVGAEGLEQPGQIGITPVDVLSVVDDRLAIGDQSGEN